MDHLFKINKQLDEVDFKSLWENALFVFDANVMLDLYRFPENAKRDLFNILDSDTIKSRIWLPFQVALEFEFNRLDVISDQKTKFNSVKSIVKNALFETEKLYKEIQEKLSTLKLKKKHSAIDPDNYINEVLFNSANETLEDFLAHLSELDEKQMDVSDTDDIKRRVFEIFNDKIGKSFKTEELNKIFEEGDRRYTDNIPPGYNDKSKEGFYMYKDMRIFKKYGDLLVWKQIIKKCVTDNIKYIILVTGDSKDDWWNVKRGKRIGPRRELLNELYFEAPSVEMFHMYETSSFMQYAKEYLEVDIEQQSIDEAKDILAFDQREDWFSGYKNMVLLKTEIEAAFPGGEVAWRRYLEDTLDGNVPVKFGAVAGSYTVVVKFIVSKDGSISEVNVENDPGFGMAEEAMRVIKQSPKWTPAIQEGYNVNAYRRQPITFIVE